MKSTKIASIILAASLVISTLSVSAGAYDFVTSMSEKDKEKVYYGPLPPMWSYDVPLNRMVKNEASKRYLKNIDPDWADAQKVAYLYTNIVNQGRHRTESNGKEGDILYTGMGTCGTFSNDFTYVCSNLGIRSREAGPLIRGVDHIVSISWRSTGNGMNSIAMAVTNS